ncbi:MULTISPECIES: hypothetical protein [Shewanella]|uniref:hypothetical protein n=1 Tax=Shewanella TaxID=22 RepID=UPI002495752D|nr:hypothetical protein [Shewanella japonica]
MSNALSWIVELVVGWLAENISTLLVALIVVGCIYYFNLQEQAAIAELGKQAELIKLKISMITE